MNNILFDNWESLVRTVCLTIIGYLSMIILLRAFGKRSLSKMNAFDFIVTIALGSSLASLSLNKNVTLADGVTAIGLLLLMQYLFAWLSVKSKFLRSIITGNPTLIFYRGKFLKDVMRKEGLTTEEILNAAREKGLSTLDHIDMVGLETTGELSFIDMSPQGKIVTMEDVHTE